VPTLNLREGVQGKRSGGNEEKEEGIERAYQGRKQEKQKDK